MKITMIEYRAGHLLVVDEHGYALYSGPAELYFASAQTMANGVFGLAATWIGGNEAECEGCSARDEEEMN